MRAIEFIESTDATTLNEEPLVTYQPIGNFEKSGPFTGADKRLVPHATNQAKAYKFFEKTPFDFRLFFSNVPGTGKYHELGLMSPSDFRKSNLFNEKNKNTILNGHENSITVVYVGNKGDAKVVLTPWMMAHRLGHALIVGRSGSQAWKEVENHFFSTINNILLDYYGKDPAKRQPIYTTFPTNFKWNLMPEYRALFNAIGTQHSSRSNLIKRPYEFLFELFAQYLGTGHITLNPLPTQLGYGRKAWGRPTQYMTLNHTTHSENKQIVDTLAYDLEILFSNVLANAVGNIFVM